MFNFLKYSFWPTLKVRLITFWWTIKYGGRKNIPPELIFERMKKSMERAQENLMNALRVIPDDLSEEKRKELANLIREGAELEREIKRVEYEKINETNNKNGES